jgi:uridine kinase
MGCYLNLKIFKKPFFIFLLLIKVILAILFSSEYNTELFLPFLNSVSLENWNPWQSYFEKGLLDTFPYHGLMLLLLTPFAVLGNYIGGGEFLIKIPLLIADIGILLVLLKMLPKNENKILIYYFLNPIVIYATYIHSQLDLIPTSLFFICVYFLTIQKIRTSSIFFGLAIATKVHVLIAIPLMVYYLIKKFSLAETLKYFILSILVVLFFDIPFIFSDGFFHMVLANPKQNLLFDTYYTIGSLKLLLPILVIMIVFLHLYNQSKLNHDLMFFYFGILFTSLVFFIYPAPAWYLWMIPFVSFFFIKNHNQHKTVILYAIFSLSYCIFFIFFYDSDYIDIIFLSQEVNFKIDDENLRNISFTILEATLISVMFAFYRYGIRSNSIYKKKTNLVFGIGGDSGTGKTRLLSYLENILRNKLISIEGDGEHKWERGNLNWAKFTHLDPKANFIHKQAEVISLLKNDQSIHRSEYNHSTGKFSKPELIKPREFIGIAGLHPFYLPKLRKKIDFKIYLDTNEDLRRYWKIIRDSKDRGYSKETVSHQIESRVLDAKKYIYPQKEFADLVVNFFPINDLTSNTSEDPIDIGLKINFGANISIENLMDLFNPNSFSWDYNGDLNSQYLILNSEPSINFETLAKNTIENLNEITDLNAKWSKGYDGFIQYICLKIISEKLKEE